jgi:mitochondrial fission protein ELM1
MEDVSTLTCWVVTDGVPGTENQCLGLAHALGLEPVIKRVRTRAPWRHLPPRLWLEPMRALTTGSDRLEPPCPDLLIASGRQSVALSIAVRRLSQGRTFTVQIQKPAAGLRHFDLVVAPLHDRLSGGNVFSTRGSLNGVTAASLAAAARRFAPDLAHLPRPLVAVLVGGSNRAYRLTPRLTRTLAGRLAGLNERYGAGLAVTTSRRTGPANEVTLRDALRELPATAWDGRGENPYFGYLALADAIVVTCDSVNMVSEACTTGKPVYVFELDGGSEKFRRFHERLRRDGLTRPFEGALERWRYAPLDDTARAAQEVRRRMAARAAPAARTAP